MSTSTSPTIAAQRMAKRPRHSKATILLADDSMAVLRVCERLLSRAGYRVLLAENGRQAVDTALAEKPDLVVLDINMPELDGYEVCEELLRNEQWDGDTPVLFLTGSEEPNLETLGNLLGAFLSKPAEPQKLIDTVEALLRRHR